MERQLEFYDIDYGGSKIPKEQKLRLLRRAWAWLDLLMKDCPALRFKEEKAIRHAICAAADAIFELEQRVILKEQNGDLSLTYAARLSVTERQLVAQAIFPYLCGSGLLYRGVREW